jgi:hypothetical protein
MKTGRRANLQQAASLTPISSEEESDQQPWQYPFGEFLLLFKIWFAAFKHIVGEHSISPPPLPHFFLPSELSFAKCDAPGAQQTFNVMKQVCQYPSLANHRPLQNQFRVCTSLQSKSWTWWWWWSKWSIQQVWSIFCSLANQTCYRPCATLGFRV